MTDDDFREYDDFDSELDELNALGRDDNEEVPRQVRDANADIQSRSESHRIGHIIVSTDLEISRNDSQIFAYIYTDTRDDVQIGDYVQVPYPEKETGRRGHAELFGIIENLRYMPRTELNDTMDAGIGSAGGRDFNEGQYQLTARIRPLNIILDDNERLSTKGVSIIPKPFSFVYPCDNEDYLRAGLNIPENGPFVGHMSVSGERRPAANPLAFKMPNPLTKAEGEPVIFRHTLVAGSTGKGKTHFTKNFIRQYATDDKFEIEVNDSKNKKTARKQLNIVVIDPENEYSELADDNPKLPGMDDPIPEFNGHIGLEGKTLRDLERDGIKVGGINNASSGNDLVTFIPEVKHSTPPSTKKSQTFGIPFTFVKDRPNLLIPYDAGEPTKDAIKNLVETFFSRNPTGTYEAFIRWVSDPANEEELKIQLNIDEGIWAAAARRIDQPSFSKTFDQSATNITDITNEIFRPGRTAVIPTSHLSGGTERLVVMCILSMIVDNKLKDHKADLNIKDTPMLVALDEAHNYLSEPTSTQQRYIVNKFIGAAKQGRKYRLGLFLITQNPLDIADDVNTQINGRVYLGMEPDVLSKLEVPGGFSTAIANFGKGQAVVKAPDVHAVEIMGLPVTLTQHSK